MKEYVLKFDQRTAGVMGFVCHASSPEEAIAIMRSRPHFASVKVTEINGMPV